MLNSRFTSYFQEKFFQDDQENFEKFLQEIEKPIPRTIRIKGDKMEIVKKNLDTDGWILNSTNIARVFSLDRKPDFDPLERRIGMTHNHLIGDFYIQELAAAHPVDLLANGEIHDDAFLILDMASSPGGKTTQLAEYFPNSFIIANEPSRERIPQLLQNLERMHSPNIAITLYPGQQWRHFEEIFDRILLDAPCSGEGTLYKGTDAVKNWHIKSIKQIANLQKKLIVSALSALKVGGEMVYSTCALNDLENEGILEYISDKYGDGIEIIFEKKFWPHIDKTGGFFMAKIIKKKSFFYEKQTENIKNFNKEILKYSKRLGDFEVCENREIFVHRDKILAVKNAEIIKPFLDKMYFMRLGETIGFLENGKFVPNARAYRDLQIQNFPKIILQNEEELDFYLRGGMLTPDENGYFLIMYQDEILALEYSENGIIQNNFPKDWRRK